MPTHINLQAVVLLQTLSTALNTNSWLECTVSVTLGHSFCFNFT